MYDSEGWVSIILFHIFDVLREKSWRRINEGNIRVNFSAWKIWNDKTEAIKTFFAKFNLRVMFSFKINCHVSASSVAVKMKYLNIRVI